jgi:hypothetical protein
MTVVGGLPGSAAGEELLPRMLGEAAKEATKQALDRLPDHAEEESKTKKKKCPKDEKKK